MQSHVLIRPRDKKHTIEPPDHLIGSSHAYVNECLINGQFLMTDFGSIPEPVAKDMADSIRSMTWFDNKHYEIVVIRARQSAPRSLGLRIKVPTYAL